MVVSSPDPFCVNVLRMCSKKGGEERKGSGESAYPSTDPGRNAAVGDKYALVTTATSGCQATSGSCS